MQFFRTRTHVCYTGLLVASKMLVCRNVKVCDFYVSLNAVIDLSVLNGSEMNNIDILSLKCWVKTGLTVRKESALKELVI